MAHALNDEGGHAVHTTAGAAAEILKHTVQKGTLGQRTTDRHGIKAAKL
jgi:hypothetical protein